MSSALGSLLRDLKYATRTLFGNPGLTAAVAVSIALGIAANTTVFSLVNAVLFGALPVEEPDRLVSITGDSATTAMSAYPNYVDYRDQTDVFESISARVFIVPVSLGGGEPEFP
jgi:hypothetical protein